MSNHWCIIFSLYFSLRNNEAQYKPRDGHYAFIACRLWRVFATRTHSRLSLRPHEKCILSRAIYTAHLAKRFQNSAREKERLFFFSPGFLWSHRAVGLCALRFCGAGITSYSGYGDIFPPPANMILMMLLRRVFFFKRNSAGFSLFFFDTWREKRFAIPRLQCICEYLL